MPNDKSLEELLDEFAEHWLENRQNADAVEELDYFLERFSKHLADYDEEKQHQLADAVYHGMNPIARVNSLALMLASVMIVNITGDRKNFLHDFILRVEHIFAENQSKLSHPPAWH